MKKIISKIMLTILIIAYNVYPIHYLYNRIDPTPLQIEKNNHSLISTATNNYVEKNTLIPTINTFTPNITNSPAPTPSPTPISTPSPTILPTSTATPVATQITVQEEKTPLPNKTYGAFSLTESDKKLLGTIIYLEGGNQTHECQLAIGSVIINRLNNGYWGNTLEQVIYAPGQFSPAKKVARYAPTAKEIQTVEELCANGTTIPYYVMYFRVYHYFKWAQPYKKIDDTYFSYLNKDI